ncbi:MAG: hypothetical protein Q7P63_06460 [Verrucomicrobiota bacterium JB022]|nr:hypothetical protein [Verrucomicrobiota bacterium JB022]
MAEIPYFWSQPAAVIRVTGEDATDFLQSQCSQDLRGESGSIHYGLWLDHRGRIQADSFVLRLESEAFLLVSYYSPAHALLAKLEHHIVADDVELEDATDQWQLLSIVPTADGAMLPDVVIRAPARDCFAFQSSLYVFQGRRARTPWLEVLCPHDQARPMAQALDEMDDYEMLAPEEVETLRLEAALPRVPQEAGPEDTPGESGLMEAVSLEKGCYLGQEVVNRMARLDRASRRLVAVDLPGEIAVPATITQAEAEVGELRSCVATLDGYQGFAMIKTKALADSTPLLIQGDEIHLHGAHG